MNQNIDEMNDHSNCLIEVLVANIPKIELVNANIMLNLSNSICGVEHTRNYDG